jgi:hypothetical protein
MPNKQPIALAREAGEGWGEGTDRAFASGPQKARLGHRTE